MTSVSRSFRVLLTPGKIWPALTDFARWGSYGSIENAQNKGWGNRWTLQDEAGQNARVFLYQDDELMQEWCIEEWSPPKRFALASRVWHGDSPAAQQTRMIFALSPVTPAETTVEIQFESRFTHPLWGLALSLWPMRGEFDRVLARFEKGLVAALPDE